MIVIGVDPALGGGFARVVCDLGEKLTILDAITTYDLARTEDMIDLLTQQIKQYRPSEVIIEADAMQKALGTDDRMKALSTLWGFQIRPHTTRGEKLDPVFGVAKMDQSFRLGEIRIPYGDQTTQDRMAPLLAQLRAWRPDVKTKDLTQDLCMALWFAWRRWMKIRVVHETPLQPATRPSWLFNENAYRGTRLAG